MESLLRVYRLAVAGTLRYLPVCLPVLCLQHHGFGGRIPGGTSFPRLASFRSVHILRYTYHRLDLLPLKGA